MCNFCSNFGTPLPKIDFGWVSTPKVRSRPAGRTQNEQKMKMGKPFTECPYYALYVRAPKCIIVPSE